VTAPKITSYFLGNGPHAAECREHANRVEISMFNGTIRGIGITAEEAAIHLADQLRMLACLVEASEGVKR
jgi:hypothetical protein